MAQDIADKFSLGPLTYFAIMDIIITFLQDKKRRPKHWYDYSLMPKKLSFH